MVLLADVPFAFPQAAQSDEYQLKAAFLLNFAKFIDWPENSFWSPQSAFTFCVVGKDPFGSALNDNLLGKKIEGRPVQIRHFPNANSLTEARHCQIVFIAASEEKHLRQAIKSLKGTAALLVGETDGFAASGGAIEFLIVDGHIRFAINPEAADRADLKVSSQLLALAKIVHDEPNNGKS